MQETKFQIKAVNYTTNGAGDGGGKSSVLTQVTYKCTTCSEFITINENR